MIVRSRRFRIPWVLCILCPLFAVGEFVEGQSGTLTTEENFRAQQNGTLLGQLRAGMSLEVLEATDEWLQFDLDAWVWTQSLQAVNRGDFDLVVSVEGGENIRGTPGGEVLGHLEQGTLLETVERIAGWARVRRRAWVWRRSVALFGADPSGGSVEQSDPPGPSSVADGEVWAAAGSADAPILSAPDGDTLARAVPRAELEVMSRQGSWVRVRVEGWIWQPDTPTYVDGPDDSGVLSPDDVALEPEAFAGRVISWRLQFISLEKAEAVRTDFFEGEPFLLCRYGGDGGQFVYVTVPPDRLAEVEGFVPLEYFTVTARVRTGASVLTGTPIVDLLSFERERR